jgi:hypothetical protein
LESRVADLDLDDRHHDLLFSDVAVVKMSDCSNVYVTLKWIRYRILDRNTVLAIMSLIDKYPTLYGIHIRLHRGDEDTIFLTRYCVEDDHICRTLSHESLHVIVDHFISEQASVLMDREDVWHHSVLDRLAFEGYLGNEYAENKVLMLRRRMQDSMRLAIMRVRDARRAGLRVVEVPEHDTR